MTTPSPHHLDAAPAHNLPAPPTPLLGRSADVAAVLALLRDPDARLVTLLGPGGIGKTRLALRVAAEALPAFPDGIWLVDLTPLADPALIPAAIARVLGVPETSDRPLAARLADHLRSRRLLLLLDNCEHLLGMAQDLAALLGAAPGLRALATSRAPLRLAGEQEYPLAPLALPDPGKLVAEEALRSPAVALFTAQARRIRPDFALTDANVADVVAICRRLDGLPLALELAAARVRLLPPRELLPLLERRLAVLTGGLHHLPPRQRALHRTIAWSHDLLGSAERVLFRRFAIFAGGATPAAVEAICAADGVIGDPLETLDALVSQSLLAPREGAGGAGRGAMLETIREFAAEQLVASGEGEALRARHADYYMALAASVGRARPPGWLVALAAEEGNLRAALTWALDAGGDPARGLALATELRGYWRATGQLGEGLERLRAALACAPDAPEARRAAALRAAGVLASDLGEFPRAEEALGEALALRRALGDALEIGQALNSLAEVALNRGEYARARGLLEEGLALHARHGDQVTLGVARLGLGLAAYGEGHHAEAAGHFRQALDAARAAGDTQATGEILSNLGYCHLARGDYAAARAALAGALALARDHGHPGLVAEGLEGLAGVLTAGNQATAAARLLGAAARLREERGVPRMPVFAGGVERAVATGRARLGAAAWAAAGDDAAARPLDVIIDEALAVELGEAPAQPSLPTTPRFGLTAREAEVLLLVAEGLPNAAVAERLFLAPRTVNSHLTSIYTKIGVDNRAAATRFALEHGLA